MTYTILQKCHCIGACRTLVLKLPFLNVGLVQITCKDRACRDRGDLGIEFRPSVVHTVFLHHAVVCAMSSNPLILHEQFNDQALKSDTSLFRVVRPAGSAEKPNRKREEAASMVMLLQLASFAIDIKS